MNLIMAYFCLVYNSLLPLAQQPIRRRERLQIGVIGPVTGKSSEDMGQSIVGGARVFLADINQMGGILGRRAELVERDD